MSFKEVENGTLKLRANNRDLKLITGFGSKHFLVLVLSSAFLISCETTQKSADSTRDSLPSRGISSVNSFVDSRGHSPLHEATRSGDVRLITSLVQSGGDINIGDAMDETPLHLAARTGQTAAVRTLVRLGATVSTKDRKGHTPLHEVARNGDSEAVRFLVGAGANINEIEKTKLHFTYQLKTTN